MQDLRDNFETQANKEIKYLFAGVVPERYEEIMALWEHYEPTFNVVGENFEDQKFVMCAGMFKFVKFNHRAMRSFWLASFTAWEGYEVIQNSVFASKPPYLTRFEEMVECLKQILESDDSLAIKLPEGVPEPLNHELSSLTMKQRVVRDIAIIAVGWAFLHEVMHIKHQQDGTSAQRDSSPECKHAEELSCDEFATCFILNRASEYAELEDNSLEDILTKRQLGIYFAIFSMVLISDNYNWHNSSDTHPPLQTRINLFMQQVGSNCSIMSYVIALCAYEALGNVFPNAPRLNLSVL